MTAASPAAVAARGVPFAMFADWMELAKSNDLDKLHPNAMSLATATPQGAPSVRMVLMQHYDHRGFCFYTNFNSRKGRELLENPNAAALFFWKGTQRQVRIEGRVEVVSSEEADAYHATRPRGSQLGAWASKQSTPYGERGRQELLEAVADMEQRFPEGAGPVPRPPQWSGFRLMPTRFEFWQEGEFRYHTRTAFEHRAAGGGDDAESYWDVLSLYP